MEFASPDSGDLAVFRELRKDFEIGLGCVDVTPGRIDAPETIAARVRAAMQYLAPERIELNPDCGFAPGSGAAVGIDEAYDSTTRWRLRASCARNSDNWRMDGVEYGR
jgi:5-methyltetrahydropteroyltriglutamate--homocysteine methyltransferase